MTTTTNGSGTITEPTIPTAPIEINRIESETLRIPIVGTSPLIVNRFSEKAKRQMLDNMQGRKTPKQRKDPEAEYLAAFYRFHDTPNGVPPSGTSGVPAIAFKSSSVGGARYYAGIKMTELRQFLFFRGELGADGQQLFRIEGEPRMREDVVRVARGGADLRYRPEYPEWSSILTVVYVKSALTRNSVVSLIDAGGMGVGVAEWRVEKKGDFGTYTIDQSREVEVIG